jgi:hypothetical protein
MPKSNDNRIWAAISAVRHGVGNEEDREIVREVCKRDDEMGRAATRALPPHERPKTEEET